MSLLASTHLLRPRAGWVVVFVLAAAFARLVPHPPNFSPIGAIAFFGGAMLASRKMAFAVPLLAMLMSDLVLHVTSGRGFHALGPVVYAAFALTVCLGRVVRSRLAWPAVALGSVAAATLFFTITNLAVWAFSDSYPRTGAGLLACFVAAIPFFANTLASQIAYGVALFGGYAALADRQQTRGGALAHDAPRGRQTTD
jgi:hypothetical protein